MKRVLPLILAAAVSACAGGPPERENTLRVRSGTGVPVNPRGDILTAAHVIEGCGDVGVIVEGAAYPTALAAVDEARDLAVLRYQGPQLRYAFFSEYPVLPGVRLQAVGYPRERRGGLVISPIIVSQWQPEGQASSGFIAIEGELARGQSGSPLMDKAGLVHGLVQAQATQNEQYTGIALALTAQQITSFLYENIIPFRALPPGNAPPQNVRDFVVRLSCIAAH